MQFAKSKLTILVSLMGLILLSLPLTSFGAIVIVGDGGGEYATLTLAVAAAGTGDSIHIKKNLGAETVTIPAGTSLAIGVAPGFGLMTGSGSGNAITINGNAGDTVRIHGMCFTNFDSGIRHAGGTADEVLITGCTFYNNISFGVKVDAGALNYLIHSNAFLGNNGGGVQGSDAAGAQQWNDGVGVGNYWSDNTGGCTAAAYTIGGGLVSDNYPETYLVSANMAASVGWGTTKPCTLSIASPGVIKSSLDNIYSYDMDVKVLKANWTVVSITEGTLMPSSGGATVFATDVDSSGATIVISIAGSATGANLANIGGGTGQMAIINLKAKGILGATGIDVDCASFLSADSPTSNSLSIDDGDETATIVDNTAPTCAIVTANGQRWSASHDVVFTISDDLDLDKMTRNVDGLGEFDVAGATAISGPGPKTDTLYLADWPGGSGFAGAGEGTDTIVFIVYDDVGNTDTCIFVFIKDTTAPTVDSVRIVDANLADPLPPLAGWTNDTCVTVKVFGSDPAGGVVTQMEIRDDFLITHTTGDIAYASPFGYCMLYFGESGSDYNVQAQLLDNADPKNASAFTLSNGLFLDTVDPVFASNWEMADQTSASILYTNSPTVDFGSVATLTETNPLKTRFYEGATLSEIAFALTGTYTFVSSADGVKIVNLSFSDKGGNYSSAPAAGVPDSIELDATSPSAGILVKDNDPDNTSPTTVTNDDINTVDLSGVIGAALQNGMIAASPKTYILNFRGSCGYINLTGAAPLPNGNTSVTLDCIPCAQADGQKFGIEVIITDGAGNTFTAEDSILYDITAPGALAGVSAEPGSSVSLKWTPPGGDVDRVVARYEPWNGAFCYPGPAPAYPSSANNGFVVGTVAAAPGCYEWSDPGENIYYFSLFAMDKAGNVGSAAANARTGSYTPGDMHDGSTPGQTDEQVNFFDLFEFAQAYFGSGPCHADIAPQLAANVPDPDGSIDFNDLGVFAPNYGFNPPGCGVMVAGDITEPAPVNASVGFQLLMDSHPVVGELFQAKLLADNDAEYVQLLHMILNYDSRTMQLVETKPGQMVSGNTNFFKARSVGNKIEFDAAALGRGATFPTTGEVVTFTFKLLQAGPIALTPTELEVRDTEGNKVEANFNATVATAIPNRYEMTQNYPNPFNATTQISFALPTDGKVSLKVYNIMGQLVRNLVDQNMTSGYHIVTWDGRDESGKEVSTGVYFYNLKTGGTSITKKMTMLK